MSKTVLITGGAGGIGSAIARVFAQNGYCVAIGYHRSASAAQCLAQELCTGGGDAVAIMADISDRKSAFGLVQKTVELFGGLDVLVNNAGVSKIGLFTDMTQTEWDELCGVNLAGSIWCAQAAAEIMVRKKNGAIVNVSSMWGEVGASCEVGYSATKAGVIGLTRALAKELGPSGVRVNCVSPGMIATAMNAALSPETLSALAEDTPLGRIGTPEEVARTVLFLASDAAGFVTGQVLGCSGGFII